MKHLLLLSLIIIISGTSLSVCPQAGFHDCGVVTALAAPRSSSASSVAIHIRYHAPGAGEVWLIWGLNGWKHAPQEIRPPGTVLKDNVIQTPLAREGDVFSVVLQIPSKSLLDYGFYITKTDKDASTKLWDLGQTFRTEADSLVEFHSAAYRCTDNQLDDWLWGRSIDLPLVTQEILYHIEGVSEASLVWGVKGWYNVTGNFRPPGTVVEDRLMRTPLVREGNTFRTKLRLPPGMPTQFGVVLQKTTGGFPIHVWEYGGDRPISIEGVTGEMTVGNPAASSLTQRKVWSAGQPSDLPIVRRRIYYRAPRATEVALIWGIDEWQAMPRSGQPIRTTVKNGLMSTFLAREGDLFMITVEVPEGSVLKYRFAITQTEGSVYGQRTGNSLGVVTPLFDNRIDVESGVTKAQMDRASAPSDKISLVPQEIRYRIAGAEEVWLVWGINGWQSIPEEARPSGTVYKDNVMHSPMKKNGEIFSVTIRVPRGTILEYKFVVTRTSRGAPVSVWQDSDGQAYWKIIRSAGTLEEKATVSVTPVERRRAWLAGQAVGLPLVTEEIRYHAPGAGEVWLIWGLEGWHPAPDSTRPPGTLLKDGHVMHSPMMRTGQTFGVSVQIPPGTELRYAFLITKTTDGKATAVRQDKSEAGESLTRTVSFDGVSEVRSTAWLTTHAVDRSLVTQEIRYRIAGAGEVWLEWGINGWQTVPEGMRPADTIMIDDKVMRSRLIQKGDMFSTTVRVPSGTRLNYRFVITKTGLGTPITIVDTSDGQDFGRYAHRSGSIDEKATVTVVTR